MHAAAFFTITLLAFAAAQCPTAPFNIGSDADYMKVQDCTSLPLTSISGTSVALDFNNLVTLTQQLNVANITSTTFSMPSLTSSAGFQFFSTPLTNILVGAPGGSATGNGILNLNGNTGSNLVAVFNIPSPTAVQVQGNPGLVSFNLTGSSVANGGQILITSNQALTSAYFVGQTQFGQLTVNTNPNLAALVFTASALTASNNVAIDGAVFTSLVAPFTSIAGGFSLTNNGGSFTYVSGPTTTITSDLTVSNNAGLQSFIFTPSGSQGALVINGNANLNTATIASSNYAPSSITVGASTVGLTLLANVISTGAISITSPGATSSFNTLSIGLKTLATTVTLSGNPIINALNLGTAGNQATVSSILLNGASVNTINVAGISTVSNQLLLQSITATGSNPSININQLNSIGQSLGITAVNGFQNVSIQGLSTIGFSNGAIPIPFTITNNAFPSGATVAVNGNYSINNQVSLFNNTAASFDFTGLNSIVGHLDVTQNTLGNSGTIAFNSLQCVSNITISNNIGNSIVFPILKYLGTGGIASGTNPSPFAIIVDQVSGTNSACYYCGASSGVGSTCGNTAVISGYSNACAGSKVCPFVNTVAPSTTGTPTTGTVTTGNATTGTVTTGTVTTTTGNATTTATGTATTGATTTGTATTGATTTGATTATATTGTVTTGTTTGVTTGTTTGTTGNSTTAGSRTGSATAVGVSVMVIATVLMVL